MNDQFRLCILPNTFAICRLDSAADIPAWATAGGMFSITRTAEELSVVCEQSLVPNDILCERDWRCLQVGGPLPFTMVGVLASLVRPLAEANISIFAISTFDTDYLLLKAVHWAQAIEALERFGHTVSPLEKR